MSNNTKIQFGRETIPCEYNAKAAWSKERDGYVIAVAAKNIGPKEMAKRAAKKAAENKGKTDEIIH